MLNVAVNVGTSVCGSTRVASSSRRSTASRQGFRAIGPRFREPISVRNAAPRREWNIIAVSWAILTRTHGDRLRTRGETDKRLDNDPHLLTTDRSREVPSSQEGQERRF